MGSRYRIIVEVDPDRDLTEEEAHALLHTIRLQVEEPLVWDKDPNTMEVLRDAEWSPEKLSLEFYKVEITEVEISKKSKKPATPFV